MIARRRSRLRDIIARGVGSVGIILACAGCRAAPTAAQPAPSAGAPSAARLKERALVSFVPAAGLRWLLIGEPSRLAANESFMAELAPLVPAQRIDTFTVATGVDLREVDTGIVAGLDYGELYLASLPAGGEEVQKRFVQRVHIAPTVRRPHPQLTRMTSVVGTTPQSLVLIEGQLMAVAVGDLTLARIIELYALGKLSVPPALEGAALSVLPNTLEAAPLRVYAPGPFPDAWAHGARGLLGGTLAVGLAVSPLGNLLVLELVAVGDWPTELDPIRRLEALWRDLATSNLGRLLGLNEPKSGPRVRLRGDMLVLSVTVATAPVAAGLHAAVAAEAWELLGLPPPTAPSSNGNN